MKPIFCINVSQNKNNQTINGNEFVTAKVSSIRADMLENAIDQVTTQEEKLRLPRWTNILRLVCLCAFLICFSIFFSNLLEGGSFTEAYQNGPLLLWIGVGSLLLWGLLAFLDGKKEKTVNNSDETQRIITTADQLLENVYQELHVPESAANMDIMVFRYVEKKGQIVPKNTGILTFFTCVCKAFSENGAFCIADADQRYEIPFGQIRGIITVNKDGSIPVWNKEIPINKPPYKQYKLRIDNYGFIHFKPYYILEWEHNGETWGMYFPSYELPTIESLTSHHPE